MSVSLYNSALDTRKTGFSQPLGTERIINSCCRTVILSHSIVYKQYLYTVT
uniref:Uncharacterized protein n=1 Tax=Arundo donax TaxID=35708 RepID=A0A0A8Z926_ARUDO